MAVYIRLVELNANEEATRQGRIEQVYSPDDATEFSYNDAKFFRQKAFEHWNAFDWMIENVASGTYRLKSNT
jgi:hypothetical protein